MTCGDTPFLSITSDSRGNMRPSAKPKTVIAAMAARKLIKRYLSMHDAPHEFAAGESEACDEDHVDEEDGEGDRLYAESVGLGTGNGWAQEPANTPHGSESGAAGDEVGSGEIIAEDGKPGCIDGEGAGADNEHDRPD